jgi:methionyl-tRNA synthetase
VNALSILMAPYLPFSSDKIWKKLGNKNSVHSASWDDTFKEINIGFKLEKPKPLFKKLELTDFVTEEDPFSKLDLRVAKIIDVKDHPNADTLYMMHLDLGALGKRVIVAGMKPYYSKDELKDRNIIIVANLKPANIRGVKSNGMLLAAEDGKENCSLLKPGDANPGSEIFIAGVPREPKKILEFEDFKKVNMTINEKQEATYGDKILMGEKGKIVSDKKIKKGSRIL